MIYILLVLYTVVGTWLGLKYYDETDSVVSSILAGAFWLVIFAIQDDPVSRQRDKFYLRCRYCYHH